jgi:RNA polymerase sigma-70 factor, ECF subfamily
MKNMSCTHTDATVNGIMYPDELTLSEKDATVATGVASERISAEVELSFEELFTRYNSMVFSLAFHMLGDREEALDVSQEVFLTIYRKMDTFRGESSLKTWIYCIAANRATNRFRWWNRLRRRGTVSLEEHLAKSPNLEVFCNLASEAKSPEEELMVQEERAEIERMLLDLPLQQRIAIVMRDIEGLSYEEIAESLNLSLGTVKSRIARGRELLKRRFNGVRP